MGKIKDKNRAMVGLGMKLEIQRKVPEIFDAVKYYVDNSDFVPGKFILAGSSQFKLKKNVTDSLACRAAFLKLLPFSLSKIKKTRRLRRVHY